MHRRIRTSLLAAGIGLLLGAALCWPTSGATLTGQSGQTGQAGQAAVLPAASTLSLGAAIVGIASRSDGAGYWLVARDGGVFSFGDAAFHGSTGGIHLAAPIVGMATTPDGAGYWLVARDGGVFSFGDAVFHGSTGGIHLAAPIVGMAATPDGAGYWLVARDGGAFSFGDAAFHGSAAGSGATVIGIARSAGGAGYVVGTAANTVIGFGDVSGLSPAATSGSTAVGIAAASGAYLLSRADGSVLRFPVPSAPVSTSGGTSGTTSGAPLLTDGFSSMAPGIWTPGSTYGPWNPVFNGYGTIGITSDPQAPGHVLTLSPGVSTTSSETHSSLVRSTQTFGDFDMTVRLRTVNQLRTGSAPNPWEVGWVLWHYTDNTHFYYFLPKPTGWELGKEDPSYPGNQRFLAFVATPTFPIGPWYTVRVRQVGSTITAWVDGTEIVSFTDTQSPYPGGSMGLYSEDSTVNYAAVEVNSAS